MSDWRKLDRGAVEIVAPEAASEERVPHQVVAGVLAALAIGSYTWGLVQVLA